MLDLTWRAPATSVRRLAGTLVAVPLVVFALGSEYSCTREDAPGVARIEPAPGDGARGRRIPRRPLRFVADGTPWNSAAVLLPGERLAVDLTRPATRFHLTLQADCCDDYALSGRTASGETMAIGTAPHATGDGLRTRTMGVALEQPVVTLYVTPVSGDEYYSVAAIRVSTVFRISHWWLAIAPWLVWSALFGACLCRPAVVSRIGRRLLTVWQRADAYVASLMIITIVLRLPPPVLTVPAVMTVAVVVGLTVPLVLGCRLALERLSAVAVAYNLAIVVAPVWLVPHLIARVIEDKVSAKYETTVDHRLRPDGDEVNGDSLRFRGSSESIDREDFNILFLGDSFTYGFFLEYEDAPPYIVERLLDKADCSPPVRVVNFGWVSSSPLLSYRLLRDVGRSYHPDLIVYLLDMTDFHDDLKYASMFAHIDGARTLDRSRAVSRLLETLALKVLDRDQLASVVSVLRRPLPDPAPASFVPSEKFFATNQPLEESRRAIEMGVVTNLRAIHAYAQELGADMVLVIPPRAFQYSDREVPGNWEADAYDVLGPHVLAPFAYFEDAADGLPFPVFSLLPAFRNATEYPLYLRDDPHWNRAGAHLAAGAIADYLRTQGVVPCK